MCESLVIVGDVALPDADVTPSDNIEGCVNGRLVIRKKVPHKYTLNSVKILEFNNMFGLSGGVAVVYGEDTARS